MTLPENLFKKVQNRVSKSSLWGHQNRQRTNANRDQSPSDSPPGLTPELKRGLKAVKGGPGTSKESPGGSAFAKKVPKSSKIVPESLENVQFLCDVRHGGGVARMRYWIKSADPALQGIRRV